MLGIILFIALATAGQKSKISADAQVIPRRCYRISGTCDGAMYRLDSGAYCDGNIQLRVDVEQNCQSERQQQLAKK